MTCAKLAVSTITAMAVAFATLTTLTAVGQTTAPTPHAGAAVGTLRQIVSEVQFADSPLEEVISWLRDTTGTNIMVHWEQLAAVGVDRDRPVSLRVQNVSVAQLLWLVLSDVGGTDTKLAYRASGNVLVISTVAELEQEIIVRTYDVGDLLAAIPRFPPAVQIDMAQALQGGAGGGAFRFEGTADTEPGTELDSARPITIFGRPGTRELIALITDTIEPDSWESGGGVGRVSAYRNLLVVRNTRRVHQLLGGYTTE